MSSKKQNFTVRPFEGLKKRIESIAAVAPPSSPVSEKKVPIREISEEELFNKAMDDVQVIEAFRNLSCARSPSSRTIVSESRDPQGKIRLVLAEIADGTRPMNLPDTQEYVEWSNPDYRSVLTEQLHEGRFSVQAFLDLHGCSVPQAEEELQEFLRDSLFQGLRCVKIIHGRGLRSLKGPRIKETVVRRLAGRYRADVVAYVTARQCDGGLGALYVLLAKR